MKATYVCPFLWRHEVRKNIENRLHAAINNNFFYEGKNISFLLFWRLFANPVKIKLMKRSEMIFVTNRFQDLSLSFK